MNDTVKEELLGLRKRIIENEVSDLNDMQQKAVLATDGPLLVLAGAGSGKTTVLVNRIAQLLRWGSAYESSELYGEYNAEDIQKIRNAASGTEALPDELAYALSIKRVQPWRILAITFTNKAANELKERICRRVGDVGNDVWASTFHSCCTRILRRFGERLGYSNHFTIYDTDDQKRLLKDCFKALNIDEKLLPMKSVIAEISGAKDNMISPAAFRESAGSDSRLGSVSRVYTLYQKRLLANDAMDFDDIIYNTVLLFRQEPDVLEKYREQFLYVMVDEYQDTNTVQSELVRLISGRYKNLCVVGDDDQSIYKFRGATVRNILEFDKGYEKARVIKLEQNYRSTKTIISGANSVIRNNYERRDKSLWTDNENGDKIVWYTASNEREEAEFIADEIEKGVSKGAKYSDYAVLYRMNTQSQIIERALVRKRVPYRIIGGHRFFDRREIRDMVAYLNVISNHNDNIRLKRIINIPKRGIGDRTISNLEDISATLGQSMFETMKQADQFEALAKSSDKLSGFCEMIERYEGLLGAMPISELYEKMVAELRYEDFISKSSEHGESAIENIHELTSAIVRYEEDNADEATLQGFLEESALMSDIDSYAEAEDKAVLMTLHSAKGLEFENVFIPGMEESIFPGFQSIFSQEDMQEERRLAYVGITRAKKKLCLLNCENRMLFGRTNRNRPSRFLSELPENCVQKQKREIHAVPGIDIPQPKAQRSADIARSKVITTAVQSGKVTYNVGMRVNHKSFGDGTVISVKPMASDSLLEIAFDTVGTKKLMSNFAKLTII